jgi:hypothetical protein
MPVGVDDVLAGEDPVGDHKVLDQGIEIAHFSPSSARLGAIRLRGQSRGIPEMRPHSASNSS